MNWKKFLTPLLALACLVSPALSQIEAGQDVRIRITGIPAAMKHKIDADYPVSDKGTVNLPFIGKIQAAGLQPDELARAIEDAYKEADIFANPKIEVIASPAHGPRLRVVHVGGQVRKPGPRQFEEGMTVFQAVQAAGGATEFGAMNRVILYRDGKGQNIDLTKPENKGVLTELDDTIEVPAMKNCL